MTISKETTLHAIFWLSQNTRKRDFDKYYKEMTDQLVGEELESNRVRFITTGTPIRWEKNIMRLKLEIFHALCETSEFIINGVDADAYEFGDKEDTDRGNAGDYCCGNMQFEAKPVTQRVLDKYNINTIEYNVIVERLTEGLSFGSCGWCS